MELKSTISRTAGSIQCPYCSGLIWLDEPSRQAVGCRCPQCGSDLEITLFPALRQPRTPPIVSAPVMEGQASCFYHPSSIASEACEHCGRFLCSLCQLELPQGKICPRCLSHLGEKKENSPFIRSRVLVPNIALLITTLPLLLFAPLWPLVIISGPAGIFMGILGFRRAGSIPRGSLRFRAGLAIFLGLLEAGGAATVFIFVWSRIANG